MDRKVRELAIALLDDDHGICEEGYNKLHALLVETGNGDVAELVDATDGRFYLKEESAFFLKRKRVGE